TVCSASFVRLQGVPAMISLERVHTTIVAMEGVQSLHELHICTCPRHVQARLHAYCRTLHDQGIHSCTIQPEYS
ncbi:hypothetical protein B0H16DRAFT_1269292, partial [Mycena metata]